MPYVFELSPAVAGLLGTALGALPGVVMPLFNAATERRKARMALAVELGKRDHEHYLDDANKRGGRMYPLSLYVWYHYEVLAAMDAGKYNAETINRLEKQMDAKVAAMKVRG